MVKSVSSNNLRTGKTKSCGCLNVQKIRERSTKHGHTPKIGGTNTFSPTYYSWTAMKARCKNPKNIGYTLYGGKGVSYDPDWEYFHNFLSDMGERPSGTTLDRIDTNGNYCKSNCRWATTKEQGRNTSRNRLLLHKGHTKTISTWSEELCLSRQVIERRLKLGWSIEKTLETPIRTKKRKDA